MVKISFDKEQIKFLTSLMKERKEEFLEEVNSDSFEGDEKAFKKLSEKLFNVDNLNKSNSKVGKKSSKKSKKKTGYMKWLWSNEGMKVLKKENTELAQKELFSLAGKKWAEMSDSEKKKYD